MQVFKGKSADEAWSKASAKFSARGVATDSNSRAGRTKEILHSILSVANPRDRWVVSRKPAINPAFAIAEVIWIIRGCRDSRFLTYFNSSLPQYAGIGKLYHGAYGYRLRKHFLLDQLDRAYQVLSANPESRQVVLQIWSSAQDIPRRNGSPTSADVPCNISALLKVRKGRLEWSQIMRSNDLHRGTPYNFVQFTTLQEVMAGWLGVDPGEYIHFADSLHVYEKDLPNHGPLVREKNIPNTDSLALPKRRSELAWEKMEVFTRKLITGSKNEKALVNWVDELSLPGAYVNLARLLAAESARREFSVDMANELMAGCTNKVLAKVWTNWTQRTQKK